MLGVTSTCIMSSGWNNKSVSIPDRIRLEIKAGHISGRGEDCEEAQQQIGTDEAQQ